MPETDKLIERFKEALLSIDWLAARNILTEASNRLTPIQLVEELISPALERIGEDWRNGEVALSQYYMSGRICEELLEDILPAGAVTRKDQPKIAIVALEDYHLLGKRVVSAVLHSVGYGLIDYGYAVTVDDLVRRIKEDDVEIVLISVLLLASALRVKDVRKKLDDMGLEDVKIVVGGAPFSFDNQLWKEVGADAMSRTASAVVKIISRIAEGKS